MFLFSYPVVEVPKEVNMLKEYLNVIMTHKLPSVKLPEEVSSTEIWWGLFRLWMFLAFYFSVAYGPYGITPKRIK